MRLIDADALEKRFQALLAHIYEKGDNDAALLTVIQMVKSAPTVGGWISTNERLPEEWQTVIALLYYSRSLIEFESAQYTNKHFSTEECYIPDHLVTHWLPIPEPPEET